jgi:hypothetical protein
MMGVVADRAELSRAVVVAVLIRLLGDDPDLLAAVPAGEYVELDWAGQRISSQWFVEPGKEGVEKVVVDLWDDFPLRAVAEFNRVQRRGRPRCDGPARPSGRV